MLYSRNSKFKVVKGWEDFFEPFCDTVNSSFHKKFNRRIQAPKIKLKYYPIWYFFRLFNKNSFLTYELFTLFYNAEFEKEQFDFPELGIAGNLREVSREIVKMVYRFNDHTKAEIKAVISQLNLPQRYTSVNIRRGDKDTEFELLPIEPYIEKLQEMSDLKDVFVFTDDYSVIEDLQKAYPHLRFYTLANQNERGYVHANFITTKASNKKDALIRLFASIEIMRASELAVGTYTTNPGLFLGMTMPEDKFVSVQKSSWYQFDTDDVQSSSHENGRICDPAGRDMYFVTSQ